MAIAIDENQYVWTIGLDRYHALIDAGAFDEGERAELIEGTIVTMSPKGDRHDDAIAWLNRALVRGAPDGIWVRPQSAMTFPDQRSEAEPDIAVVADDSPRPYHPSTALLVVEVAVTSLRYDRGRKARLYADAGIPEYWVVDVTGRAIEVSTSPAANGYSSIARATSGSLTPGAVPSITVDVDALFAFVHRSLDD